MKVTTKHIWLGLLICCLQWICVACAGNPPANSLADITTANSEAEASSVTNTASQRIVVTYQQHARLPGRFASARPAAGKRASEQANSILRQNPSYEAITDAIAATYGLQIEQQAYLDQARFASFHVPAEFDRKEILAGIRTDFAMVVESAQPARLARKCAQPDDPDYQLSSDGGGPQWSLHKMGCAAAWGLSKGEGILIGLLDTGVRVSHDELFNSVLNPYIHYTFQRLDLWDGDNDVTDMDGHGTSMAGLIAAQGDNGVTIAGVAWDARIIPIRIADSDTTDDLLAAGILLASQLGAHIISASWFVEDTPALRVAIEQATADGSLIIAAAGNSSSQVPSFPAAYPEVLGVGSTDPDDARSAFSDYGAHVNIAAPGEGLKSCWRTGDSVYNTGSGTSLAASVATGAAALVWSHYPQKTATEIRRLLELTAAPTTGFSPAVGRIDLRTFQHVKGITAPRPDRLIYERSATFSPVVYGEPLQVEAYQEGIEVARYTSPPYLFEFDFSTIEFGAIELEFVARWTGEPPTRDSVTVIVDNTTGVSELSASFDSGDSPDFVRLDAKGYGEGMLANLARNYHLPGNLADLGPGSWQLSDEAFAGAQGLYAGTNSTAIGPFEVDLVVSRRLDLIGTDPLLRFAQRYNLAASHEAQVLFTTNLGLDLLRAQTGGPVYTGYQPDWQQIDLPVENAAGRIGHLVFALVTDDVETGQNVAEPAGWWLDEVKICSTPLTMPPYLGSVAPSTGTWLGRAGAGNSQSFSVPAAENVVGVRYYLDYQPFVELLPDLLHDELPDPGDVQRWGFGAELDAAFPIDLEIPNQEVRLYATGFDPFWHQTYTQIQRHYIVNLLGDANADGVVDQLDVDAVEAALGTDFGNPGFLGWMDHDRNGYITEADLAAVGYHWGNEL